MDDDGTPPTQRTRPHVVAATRSRATTPDLRQAVEHRDQQTDDQGRQRAVDAGNNPEHPPGQPRLERQ